MTQIQDELADPAEFLPERPESQGLTAPIELGDESPSADSLERLYGYVKASGYVMEPWQIAAFVAAVRSKPLVIAAGISGTGKSSLPRLVAEATSASFQMLSVSPDWIDSGELIGHHGLDATFQPGPLLNAAATAADRPQEPFFFLLDELNLARPEYYLAEVLSVIETRQRSTQGFKTEPIRPDAGVDAEGHDWSRVWLPENLIIVGSVNMDETTFSFSRKLLDRTFVVELSDVDLSIVPALGEPRAERWPSAAWTSPWLSVSEIGETPEVREVISLLTDVNEILQPLQQHVGYRVRDEVAIFVTNAAAASAAFRTQAGERVDVFDIALFMKVLPRVQGSSSGLSGALRDLIAWAEGDNASDRALPFCAERLQVMERRMQEEGFASFWI